MADCRRSSHLRCTDSKKRAIVTNVNMKRFDETQMHYFTKKCSSITEKEIEEASKLFSENYGAYSKKHPEEKKQGRQIKLGPAYYRNIAKQNNTYVAQAFYNTTLAAQAFYILESSGSGNMTWVIQLVVNKNYRRHGIGKKLLFSVWGFSNDRAWGLATTNPLTIKTLESATLRKVNLTTMENNIPLIRQIAQKVSFIQTETIQISTTNATVFSNFFVSHEDIPELIKSYGKEWVFSDLAEGYEWLAFIFSGQDLHDISKKELDGIFSHSEKCLVDAYSRMRMTQQLWTKHTGPEIDFIETFIPDKNCRIADMGCGRGRHTAELYDRGYTHVQGYDFSERNTVEARKLHPAAADCFKTADCRTLHIRPKVDLVLCLYDVIGSFPEEKENEKIIRKIKETVRKGGRAIVSVMNMELTRNIAKNNFDVYGQPKKLFKLKASDIMQNSGNVFNPDYYVIDSRTGTVFRKEMFRGDGMLDSEYIIRDRRYTKDEICGLFMKNGFLIQDVRYVQSGHWDVPLKNTDLKAKEILIIAERK